MTRALAGLVLLALAFACGKSTHPASGSAESAGEGDPPDSAPPPMDAREAAQWAAAQQGDAEELMRLEDLVGCEGLRDRSDDPSRRMTALRAMEYCPDFSELPWLADWATQGPDADARAALETIGALAARPRRATDPEDADDLRAGCGALLSLAKSASRPRDRRVRAVHALRMLADRGCVKRTDIPTDFETR
ncbi:MAG TPA: hypothetical protein VGM06_13885 [Polyangiaceae bacterium]